MAKAPTSQDSAALSGWCSIWRSRKRKQQRSADVVATSAAGERLTSAPCERSTGPLTQHVVERAAVGREGVQPHHVEHDGEVARLERAEERVRDYLVHVAVAARHQRRRGVGVAAHVQHVLEAPVAPVQLEQLRAAANAGAGVRRARGLPAGRRPTPRGRAPPSDP